MRQKLRQPRARLSGRIRELSPVLKGLVEAFWGLDYLDVQKMFTKKKYSAECDLPTLI